MKKSPPKKKLAQHTTGSAEITLPMIQLKDAFGVNSPSDPQELLKAHVAAETELYAQRQENQALEKSAAHGKRFKSGKRKGVRGDLAKQIEAILSRNPQVSNKIIQKQLTGTSKNATDAAVAKAATIARKRLKMDR